MSTSILLPSATQLLESTTSTNGGDEKEAAEEPTLLSTKQVASKVAVTGATGRTGSWVVQELLNREVAVVAMVRSMDKGQEVLGNLTKTSNLLTIQKVDLTSKDQVEAALEGCDAAIWCATGFSDAKTTLLERLKRLVGIALAPKQSIDFVGIPLLAQTMLDQVVGRRPAATTAANLPKVIMLSSAGVTRPSWEESKKEKLAGCADIPIVRLNPFGILDIKAESEQKLRESGKFAVSRLCSVTRSLYSRARRRGMNGFPLTWIIVILRVH